MNPARQPTQVPQLVPAQLENLEHNPQAVIEAWYRQHVYNPAVVIGGTLPSLPKKLIDKIHSGQYVHFTEFPPAKGRVRTPLYDGQLLLVQMEDVARSKKLIPDFPTWPKCFANFMAVLVAHNPTLLPDLMTYLTDTATHAKRFRWHSWVIYDQNFRLDLARKPGLCWARMDATIYAQCFMNMSLNPSEAWCRYCFAIDNVSQACPIAPTRLRPLKAVEPSRTNDGWPAQLSGEICRKFNSHKGCKFPYCKYAHRCLNCGSPGHPKVWCTSPPKIQDGASAARGNKQCSTLWWLELYLNLQ